MILTVDLATKLSAAIMRDDQGEIHWQGDSANLSPFEWIKLLAKVTNEYQPRLILFEDVPYGISGQGQVKTIFRYQGVIIAFFHRWLDNILWVNPASWQKNFPGVGKAPKEYTTASTRLAYRAEAARVHALNLGYEPPDLVAAYVASLPEGTKVLKKNTVTLAKAMTDYTDAFLMNHWAYEFEGTLPTLSGVQVTTL